MADSKIKVLWLIKGLGVGGAEKLLVGHARTGDHDRFEYHCAYLVERPHDVVEELEAAGVTCHYLAGEREWDIRWVRRLWRLIDDLGIDVVHVHSPLPAAVLRTTARMRRQRPRIIYTEHNEWGKHHKVTRLANQLTYRLDDHTIVVSAGVRDSVRPTSAQNRVEVVLHGIDVDSVRAELPNRDAVRSELGIRPDEIVIGTVANLRWEKGYDVLLDAAAKCHTVRGQPVRFVAVGQGPYEPEIRARHAALGLGDRFLLLGFRRDAVRVMTAFDVFTLASRFEGLPVALMEAMALGIPVVATDVGGVADALGDLGRLVPSEDAEALLLGFEQTGSGRAGESIPDWLGMRQAVRRIEQHYLRLAPATKVTWPDD